MKLVFLILFSLFIVFPNVSQSQSVQIPGTALKQFKASGLEVPIYQEILLSEPKGVLVKFSGVGIRKKSVVLVSVNVYAAQSYFQKPPTFNSEASSMDSLKNAGSRVMRLTFLRDVGADKIKASFSEALEKNGIDLSTKEMKSFLEKFNFDIKEKETLSFIGLPNAGAGDTLKVEGIGNSFSVTGADLVGKFWSIWYGIPADGGLEDLKAELTGKSQN